MSRYGLNFCLGAFLRYYRGTGKSHFVTDELSSYLKADPVVIRRRCIQRMREEGYIESTDPGRKRGACGGYNPTRWRFTGKFIRWADDQEGIDSE
jgi:hypothetical protein